MGRGREGGVKVQHVKKIQVVVLKNDRGSILKVLNFGASIFSLEIDGKTNVVVGPKDPEDYLSKLYHEKGKHFGASVGRHAGRISGGNLQIKELQYPLFEEEGIHIHGGKFGFTYKFWTVKEVSEGKDPFVILEYFSPDGEEGYPGNLQVRVKYTLTEANVVEVEYSAETDSETAVNLTNHTYFNLNGHGSVNEHQLKIPADEVLETDSENVPTGKLLSVAGKEVDFRHVKKIGNTFLDTVFSLGTDRERILLKGDKSGISLEIETDQPAVVVYVPPTLPKAWKYTMEIGAERAGICLETQKFPDAPNHDHFPSVNLKPGETYRNRMLWRFTSGS